MALGRPIVYDRELLVDKLNAYIDSCEDPQIKEFCLDRSNPCEDTLYEIAKDNKDLSETIKRCISKQQVFLTRAQGINPIMAIFRLKQPQHGYTDKQIIDNNITTQVITVKIGDTN